MKYSKKIIEAERKLKSSYPELYDCFKRLKNGRSDTAYEYAKHIIVSKNYTSKEYENLIDILIDFINV